LGAIVAANLSLKFIVAGAVLMFRDITERKEIEQELQRAKEAAEASKQN